MERSMPQTAIEQEIRLTHTLLEKIRKKETTPGKEDWPHKHQSKEAQFSERLRPPLEACWPKTCGRRESRHRMNQKDKGD